MLHFIPCAWGIPGAFAGQYHLTYALQEPLWSLRRRGHGRVMTGMGASSPELGTSSFGMCQQSCNGFEVHDEGEMSRSFW